MWSRILEKDYAAESLAAAMADRREVSRKLQTEYATQFGCVFISPVRDM